MEDESGFLATLDEVADTGRTQAEILLEAYHGRWQGSVDPAYAEYAY
jgi:glutamate--cysteine ligase